MEHTHEFDCPLCGAHLDSRDQLNRHRDDAHQGESRSASGSASTSRQSATTRQDRTAKQDDDSLLA